MIRVAFVTIWYPVAMGRYIFEAVKRRPDVEVWTAGPYTGRWIPWGGGIHLPMSYVHVPDLGMPLGVRPEVNYSMLESRKPWEPDIWIEANAALFTQGRPVTGKYAVVATDPHVIDYSAARAKADFLFNMQKPYMLPGDIHLPYAYDPIWHSPSTIPWQDRVYSAALLGLQYPQRTQLVERLRASGRNVRFELGPSYEDAAAIYHNTRVGLNWSSMQDTTARAFELLAFGLPAVMNRVPDLVEMFRDGEDFIGFSTLDEAVAGVEGLLADETRAVEMGRKARVAVEPHTWDARVELILKTAGLLN